MIETTFMAGGKTFPNSMQKILEYPTREFYESDHFSSATSFHFDLFRKPSGPGQPRPDQGYTVRAKNPARAESVLLMSQPGIFLDKKKYPGLQKFITSLGISVFGSKIYPHDVTMLINAHGATSATTVSKQNVRLKAMMGITIKKKFPFLSEFCRDRDTYILVIAITDIRIHDELLCKHYNFDKKETIPFGTDRYILHEKNCYRAYEAAIQEVPAHQRVCYRCFLPLLCQFNNFTEEFNYLLTHKSICVPHMNNYILPQDIPVILTRM